MRKLSHWEIKWFAQGHNSLSKGGLEEHGSLAPQLGFSVYHSPLPQVSLPRCWLVSEMFTLGQKKNQVVDQSRSGLMPTSLKQRRCVSVLAFTLSSLWERIVLSHMEMLPVLGSLWVKIFKLLPSKKLHRYQFYVTLGMFFSKGRTRSFLPVGMWMKWDCQ